MIRLKYISVSDKNVNDLISRTTTKGLLLFSSEGQHYLIVVSGLEPAFSRSRGNCAYHHQPLRPPTPINTLKVYCIKFVWEEVL